MLSEELFGKPETDAERESIRLGRRKRLLYILIVTAAMLLLSAYSVTVSSSGITASEVYQVFINKIWPGDDPFDIEWRRQEIIWRVYYPRVLIAMCVGGTLAIGGAIVQTILKNPLATPYTLGISSSAAFGAGIAIILGLNIANDGIYGIMVNAFIFSLIPAGVILAVSFLKNVNATTLILIGICISYTFSAANTLMQYFGDADAVKQAMFWTVGDLDNVVIGQVKYVFADLLFAVIASMLLVNNINVMRMGDDTATSLGINVTRVRLESIILACLITAIDVSIVGAIGFVCLLAPQISRIFVGNDMKYLIPASMVTGSLILVLADYIAKTVIRPIMLPVGAITAVVGAPVLIYLLIRNRSRTIG